MDVKGASLTVIWREKECVRVCTCRQVCGEQWLHSPLLHNDEILSV